MDLKLGHYRKDGIEVVTVEGEIDIYTAPRLRELLIGLAAKGRCQLIVNLDKVGFLDSTGLGVLAGGLKRVRPLAAGWIWSAPRSGYWRSSESPGWRRSSASTTVWTRPSQPKASK